LTVLNKSRQQEVRMKLFVFLCLAGLALANNSWKNGNEWRFENDREFVYSYNGRMLTGIPELADVYTGIAINCSVHIRSVSRDSNSYLLAVRNPKFVRINDELVPASRPGVTNWRELRLPELQEVSGEYQKYLSQPMMFTMTNGEITSAKISKNEPVWCVNFKKALALQFQAKMDVSSRLNDDSNNHILDEEQNDSSSGSERKYWTVKEETIDGVCESTYEVRELPKYMVVERPEMVPHPEACPTDKYYGITKTRDIQKCEKRSAFIFAGLSSFGGVVQEKEMGITGRSSSTRYIACGTRGDLVIQSIINDGELTQNLLGVKTERFVTGTLQTFFLSKVSAPSSMEMDGETVTLKSMMFEHTRESFLHSHIQNLESMSPEEQLKAAKEGRIPESLLSNPSVVRQALPRNFFYGINTDELSESEIKSQIMNYIPEMLKGLLDSSDPKAQHISSKALAVSRGFAMLKNKEEIMSVFEELKAKYSSNENDYASVRNIFLDTLLSSGTPKAIFAIVELIEREEFTKGQVTSFWINLPSFVRMPTKEVLESLYTLATNDKTRNNNYFYNRAIMGLSTLLEKACISSDRMTAYPVNVFGEFCNPNSEIIVGKWLPYLVHDLKYTKSMQQRNEIIVSLGLLKHKSVVGELTSVIEGSLEGTTSLNRFLAVYSLSSSAERKDPSHVIPILMAILANPAESTAIRVAAFNSVMKLNPSLVVLHKIASITWSCKDEELLKTINLAFYTLTLDNNLETYREYAMTMSKKATLVWPMIKKTPGIYPSSGSVYRSDYYNDLGIGYTRKLHWLASNSSFIPKTFYGELTYFMDQVRFNPISFGYRLSGSENLYHSVEKLFEPVEEQLGLQQERSRGVNSEWHNIVQQLKIKARENGPMDGAIFYRYLEASPIFYNFDKFTRQDLQQKVASLMRNPEKLKDSICGKTPYNYQRTMDGAPSIVMIASDLGFPIVIEFHTPTAMSVRGHLNVNCESAMPSISLDVTMVTSSQYSGWVGTTIPFTKEYAVTGVQEKFVANVPVKIEMSLDIPSGKISFNWKIETSSRSGSTDLLSYQVKPFTTYKKVADLTPLALTEHFKMISSGEKVKHVEFPAGSTNLLGMKLRVSTESPYADYKAFWDILSFYNYNPVGPLAFSWTVPALTEHSKPSLRYHEFTASLDATSVKEMSFDIKLGWGQKVQEDGRIRYHRVQLKQQQEEAQQQSGHWHKYNPFQVTSEDIESVQVHPKRQLKVKEALQNLQVDSGYGFAMIYTLSLKGSRPWSYTETLSFAAGKEHAQRESHNLIRNKWNFNWENEGQRSSDSSVSKVCMKGFSDIPLLPMWSISEIHSSLKSFRYSNEIGMGRSSCSETTITVDGHARVSKKQLEFSTKSKEARQCQELLQQQAPGAKLSEACEKVRLQANALDEIEFKTDYNNVSDKQKRYEAMWIDVVKMVLWPYFKPSESRSDYRQNLQSAGSSYSTKTIIGFHQDTPSFDLTIVREGESLRFLNVRIPYPYNLVFPLKGGRNNIFLAARALTGKSFTPECKVGMKQITTFDNKTMPMALDECFHLLSGDCSKDKSFGILARSIRSDKSKRELKVFLGDVAMTLAPSMKRSEHESSDITITINEQEIRLPNGVWTPVVAHGKTYGHLYRSTDNVYQLKSSKYNANFLYDGSRVVIYASNFLKNKLCGICGNFNQISKDDVLGPAVCAHANPEVLVASYRVHSNKCEALPQHVENQLEKDRQECHQVKQIPTQLTEALKLQAGKCNLRRHIVMVRSEDTCISKQPVTECRTACKAHEGQMVQKKTQFVCIPKGRLADLYVRKAYDGKEIQELKGMETSFDTEVQQPKKCVSTIMNNNNN